MRVKVKVCSGRDRIEEDGEILKIYTREPRERNRANYSVIKQLAKHYNVVTTRVRIIAGSRSREKVVEITGL
ncbi:MAG: DUF167 domain-containing protein [Candidatus Thermoplasmatota archaeon]|nr:DUF167 domain-containing protein [Candidatus Thermoplasmatota archaeon]